MTYALETVFGKWGVPDHPVNLSPAGREYLHQRLGHSEPRPAVPREEIVLPDGRLAPQALQALAQAVGPEHVDRSRAARMRHSAGSSTIDYIMQREGVLRSLPDAVISPASHDEVVAVLGACAQHRIAVVPFGGGTSVVGGVAPLLGGAAAVVAVAFERMAELVSVDEVSQTATVQPGITGPVLERLLAARGLMWGHLPQSWARATVGGYVATRSAGQASTGYGRSDEMVEAIVVATPRGTVRLGRAPSSAAGPDLRELFIGSEGAFGIVTQITLRVRPLPRYVRYEGLMLPDYAAGLAAFRALAHTGLTATVMRLSDPQESASTMAMSGPQGVAKGALEKYLRARGVAGGCLAILGWEGASRTATAARRDAAWRGLRRFGAVRLGDRPGRSWRKHRFEGPFLRDLLLDEGYLAETLETAGDWAALHHLHDAVTAAIESALADDGSNPLVLSHVSHVYPAGASLYYTVIARAQIDRVAQWERAKAVACEAIIAHGGTITHHHAVGITHRPWMGAEVGELGCDLLRAVKAAVDPQGLMNPGKLIPAPALVALPG